MISSIIALFLAYTYKNFIIIKSPAVTRVLECTNAEIGVGAAMALNSQDENMNKALLVTKPTINIKTINCKIIPINNNNDTQGSNITNIIIKIISPRRFLSMVIIAD